MRGSATFLSPDRDPRPAPFPLGSQGNFPQEPGKCEYSGVGICCGLSLVQAPKLGERSRASSGLASFGAGSEGGRLWGLQDGCRVLSSCFRGLGVTRLGEGAKHPLGAPGSGSARLGLVLNLPRTLCFRKTCRRACGPPSALAVPWAPKAALAPGSGGWPGAPPFCFGAPWRWRRRAFRAIEAVRGLSTLPAHGGIPGQRQSSWGLGESCKSLEFKR